MTDVLAHLAVILAAKEAAAALDHPNKGDPTRVRNLERSVLEALALRPDLNGLE